MHYALSTTSVEQAEADLLVVLVDPTDLKERRDLWLAGLEKALGVDLVALAKLDRFEAKTNQVLTLRGHQGVKAARLALVGLGELKRDELFAGLFKVGGKIGRLARQLKADRVAIAPPHATLHQRFGESIDADEGSLLLGFHSGHYQFTRYLTLKEDAYRGASSVELLVSAESALVGESDVLGYLGAINAGLDRARDLVNEPPQVLNPAAMAAAAREIAQRHGLEAKIFDKAALVEGGFNLILAVGAGSDSDPHLIHLIYRPEGEVTRRLAYVGKGVTFDTGGYSLKPGDSMLGMHCDMAGGAAVLGAAEVLGALKPPGVELHFIVPTVENMVNGHSYRPNDIIRGYGGQTVEVQNTDAEGRLILADALAYAQEQQPELIVDLATLTGACVVALGDYTAALFTPDEAAAADILGAAREAGEDLWRMPLTSKLDALLDTPHADMRNIGKRAGGAITAALFLKRWIKEGQRWAHMDIAGPAYMEGETETAAPGGTGYGVLTLVNLATRDAE
jgi:leucyl aminopeptidase